MSHNNKKKLLGLIASARKRGNGEIVAKAVAREIGNEWELSLVRLPKIQVAPCKGCYACLIPGKQCNLDDDVQWLFERIQESDAVIVTAPNYVLGPSGIVKLIADRALQAHPFTQNFAEKRTVAALTLGKEDFRGYADTALASQVSAIGLPVCGLEIFYGTHPGEIGLDDTFDKQVKRLAGALSLPEPPPEDRPDRCPRCRSDLFRVRPGGLECAICKSIAVQSEEGLDFTYFHPQFSEEGMREHFQWLLMKKMEFKDVKDRLKEIQDEYDEANWLVPERII